MVEGTTSLLICLRPGLLHAAAGLLATLINVYTARGGFWSVTAIASSAITGFCTVILGVLFLIFDTWKLAQVKECHRKLEREELDLQELKLKDEQAWEKYMKFGRGRKPTR